MHELRILQGRHRGTSFPLGGMPCLIGRRDQAHIRLYDAGIAGHHATLWPDGDGWVLTAAEGVIADGAGREQQRSFSIAVGQTARLGEVWVSIEALDRPWHTVSLPGPSGAARRALTQRLGRWAQGCWNGAVATVPRRGLVAAVFLVIVAACAGPLRHSMDTTQLSGPLPVATAMHEAAVPGDSKQSTLDAQQLKSEFRSRLEQARMVKRFELDLADRAWNMKAVLDDKEIARFGQVLAAFAHDYRVSFPIDAQITQASTTLPFKVESVISGENASMVTQDGKRLFVGDEYRGVRLAAISGKWITFVGKRRIDMVW
ncbi:MAG TPA: FHA domain-containing protein [Burkholderiaceae bacterium]